MKTYNITSLKQKLVVAAASVITGLGALEIVAEAMKYPDPDAMAVREQVLAAQSERAYQLRTLQQGKLKAAAITPDAGLPDSSPPR